MEQIIFDSGIKEYQINKGGVLRFNPSDPNVYERFTGAINKIRAVEQEMSAKAKILEDKNSGNSGAEALKIMREADQKMKKILNEIFGGENDFDALLENVNLMAVATNGERVVVNLLEALKPVMEEGAKACVSQQVSEAKLNREQRRATQR